jgi:DNA-binding response OmpR family regulator
VHIPFRTDWKHRRLTSALSSGVSTALLDRTREVSRDIVARVHRVLSPPSPLRVLCVDDQRDTADAFAAVLTAHWFDAQACYDGPAALRMSDAFHPDVAVLELGMPGLDGIALAIRLREHTGDRPLLLIAATAWSTLEDRTRTALAGFHYHLVKPVEPAALVAALDRFGRSIGRGDMTT